MALAGHPAEQGAPASVKKCYFTKIRQIDDGRRHPVLTSVYMYACKYSHKRKEKFCSKKENPCISHILQADLPLALLVGHCCSDQLSLA